MQRSRRWAVWVAVLGTGNLVACTSSTPTPPVTSQSITQTEGSAPVAAAPKASWNRVDEPSLTVEGEAAFMLAADALGNSFVVGGVVVDRAGEAQPTVWILDGTDVEIIDDPVFDGAAGAVGDVRTSGGEVVAVGATLNGDTLVPEVWQRDNKGRWTLGAPDLGDLTEASLDRVVALPDGGWLAAGEARHQGQQVTVVARGSVGGEWTLARLDESTDTKPAAVIANDDAVVVLGNARTDAGTRPTGWRSIDDGATWDALEEDALGVVGSGRVNAGAVRDDEMLAVGTGTDGTGLMLWRSNTGARWEAAPAEIEGAPAQYAPSAVTVNGRQLIVTAEPSSGSSFPLGLSQVDGEGWRPLAYPQDPQADFPPTGAGPIAANARGVLLVLPVPRSAELIVASSRPEFIRPGDGGLPDDGPYLSAGSIGASGDRLGIGGTLGPTGNLRSRQYAPVMWVGTPGSLARHDPDGLSAVTSVTADGAGGLMATGLRNGTGASTDLTTDNNDVWVGRVGDDGAIDPVGAIAGPGEQVSAHLSRHGDRWFVAGTSVGSSGTVIRDGRIWTSTNLKDWKSEEGDFADARIEAVCAAGDRVIAVGSRGDSNRVRHPMVWVRDADGSWSDRADAAGLPQESGGFSGCAGDADRVWIVGAVGQNAVVRSTTDGSVLDEVIVSKDRYLSLSGVATSAKGTVIVGTDSRGTIPRPILWSSVDGKTWTESPGPLARSALASGAVGVAFRGDQVVVLGQVLLSSALWSIDSPFAR